MVKKLWFRNLVVVVFVYVCKHMLYQGGTRRLTVLLFDPVLYVLRSLIKAEFSTLVFITFLEPLVYFLCQGS